MTVDSHLSVLSDRWSESAQLSSLGVVAVALLSLTVVSLSIHNVTWSRLGYVVTVVHEGGHALAGLLVGRRVSGITLQRDMSGATTTSGKPYGLGLIWTTWWGYPAPAALGLGLTYAASYGRSGAALTLVLAGLCASLLLARNLAAIGVGLLAAGSAYALWYSASDTVVTAAVYGLGWLLLVGSLRGLYAVTRAHLPGRREERERSDAAALQRLTWVPSVVWLASFLVVNCGAMLLAVAAVVGTF